jgi:uncharacterized protein (TIGR03435 family)
MANPAHTYRAATLLLAAAIAFTLNQTPVLAQTPATDRPSFGVATVKPNDPSRNVGATAYSRQPIGGAGLETMGSLHAFIKQAYGVEDVQISGGPNWIDGELFEIHAKASGPVSQAQLKLMLQSLLAERFKLAIRTETRQLPVYSLGLAKGGPKLEQADRNVGLTTGRTLLRGTADMAQLANLLTATLGRTVLDNTGLKGSYKFALTWAPDDPTADGPSIFTAIQEQLGLKLESTKGPVQVLVIEHAEKPSEN